MPFAVGNRVAGLDGAEGHALRCGGCGGFAAVGHAMPCGGGGGFAGIGFADSPAGGVVPAPREGLRHRECGLWVVRLEGVRSWRFAM